jgi:hypothetical protein|tara:strand:+ start:1710 stop:2732 length:1023 start_codon:yes stop_codon:yes gene_type:complete
MANVINTSLTWTQEDAQKYFLEPMFYENDHMKYIDVMTNIDGASITLDKYSSLNNITKAINTDCFAEESTRSLNTNIVLSLCRLEVEHKQKAQALFSHIKSQLLKKGISRNDLSGTVMMEILSELIMRGIQRDLSTILWWGDATNGTSGSSQALCDGIWKCMDTHIGTSGNGVTLAANRVLWTTSTINTLELMLAARNNELAASEQVIFCSRAFADSYAKELRSNSGAHTAAYADLQNGVGSLRFNGVELVVNPSWDTDIQAHGAALANFTNALAPDAIGETKAAMWTAKNNLTVGTDFSVQDVDMWYNKDCKENRFRMNYSFGVEIKEPKMVICSVETA